MKWLILIALFSNCANVSAECSVSSGEKRVSLLELYTSEGCSSCPPAEKWLSQLDDDGLNKSQLVALAFHVDYWDYIGWKDPFAKTEFSDRQRRAAAMRSSNTVYTPQFMLNGADFRGWFRDRRLRENVARTFAETAKAQIGLHVSPSNQGDITLITTVKSIDPIHLKDAEVFIAVYENQLKTAVKAGENEGRELIHDYVVQEWYGPFKLSNSNQIWQQQRLISSKWSGRNAGVAAFVQNRNTGEILQAASLKICS